MSCQRNSEMCASLSRRRQDEFARSKRSPCSFTNTRPEVSSLSARQSGSENYPPFNLERISDDRYRITIAVAGFKPDEIEITAQQNMLLVSGKKSESQDNSAAQMLHLGIANRGFERRFELADFVLVERADLGRKAR